MVRYIPLEVIASWPPPNYIDPPRRGAAAVNVTIVFMTLVTIAVFLRLYIHVFIIRWFGTGDIFIVLAYLSTIAMTALEIVGYEKYDWGRHIWDVPITNFSRSLYISWWYRIVYSATTCFTRMALICFYYRITNGGNSTKAFRKWIHLVALFSAAVGLALVFATIFQCAPIRAMWTWPPVRGARCIDEGMWTFVCGIINTIADISVVVLPIPIIYKLKLPLRKRIQAIALVSLGFLVCIVGIVRAYFVWLSLVHSYDVTWNGYGALVAATVEVHVGLLCACAPAIRLGYIRLLRPNLDSIRSTFPSKGSGSATRTEASKISMKASNSKTPLPEQKIRRPWTANSGTFLKSATRNSSESDLYYANASKAPMHELRTIDDSSDEDTRPRSPEKDEIYMTREFRVEVEPRYQPHEAQEKTERWGSPDAAVEYADAMVFARRSDIAASREPSAEEFYFASMPERRSGQDGSRASVEEESTDSTSDLEFSREQEQNALPAPTRLKRSNTLQIPQKALKSSRDQIGRAQ